MKIKTISLYAEAGSKKELCMEKIVHTMEIMQHMGEEKKAAIGTTLCGYMECCADIGYISNDEHEMLREMVVGIMKAKGCALITKSKLVL